MKHYRRTQQEREEWFWSKISKPKEGCWLWNGPVNQKTGYGFVTQYFFGMAGAHRVAFMLTHKDTFNPELVVRHSIHCISRLCCNPEHLKQGTARDNGNDKVVVRIMSKTPVARKWFTGNHKSS